MSASNPMHGWWRVQGRRFLLAALTTALAVVVAGWFSGAREIMHGVLISIAVLALLPFAIIAGVVFLMLVAGLVLTAPALVGGDAPDLEIVSDAGTPLADAGVGMVGPYYRFLGRRRHPMFWGIPAGALLGSLVLWGLIALIIVPGEARTVKRLADANLALERVYKETGRVPEPEANGQVVLAGRIVEDGYGRPLHYVVSGPWKLQSWTLTSIGFDPDDASDDLCLAGQTTIVKWAERVRTAAKLLEEITKGKASLEDRLAGIDALRCRGSAARTAP
ncbi:MAG: hypothetical protein H0T42_22990 [Deltaproteobacteria bacterium]|nr:hypothetical protein [Deltaproteobacteria bacterium]